MEINNTEVWQMLDAWYKLMGRTPARSAAERDIDFSAMKRSLEEFERSYMRRMATGSAA